MAEHSAQKLLAVLDVNKKVELVHCAQPRIILPHLLCRLFALRSLAQRCHCCSGSASGMLPNP
jgi:hypothetical protein